MMTQNLVSIVIPIYKVEKYLNRCINSIVNQTYSNLEIILVDDGSPDECPKMCDEWAMKDKRIKVIHKDNQGLGMARNTGIDFATGTYIVFFDSDDYVALETIEKAVDKIKKYNADIVLYGLNSIDSSGKIISEDIPKSDKELYSDEEIYRYILPNMIANDPVSGERLGYNMSASGAMYSLEMIKFHNWRFASEREFISEDFYSLLSLYRHVKRVTIIREALYFYCYNENSLTHVYDPGRYKRVCQCYDAMLKVMKECRYPTEVKVCLDSQYLGSVIASMKLIVGSQKNETEKYMEICDIVTDNFLQDVLLQMDVKNESRQRKALIFALKHKVVKIVYLMLKSKI